MFFVCHEWAVDALAGECIGPERCHTVVGCLVSFLRSQSSQFTGDEGYEGDEGDEGDEGNEGDEGLKGDDAYSVTTGTTLNFATCKSSATAATVSQMKDVHLDLAAHAIHAFCDEHWDGSIMEVYGYAEDAGFALAQAISHVQAECVSEGNAFGCASAEAAASAWAEATVVAHSAVIAGAFSTCEGWCDVSVSALSVASSTTFYELAVEVTSLAGAVACSEGTNTASAVAYTGCTALAYAKVWTHAYAQAVLAAMGPNGANCMSAEAHAVASAATGGQFVEVQGCETWDAAEGYASGSTEGSAESSVREITPYQ